MRELEVQLTSAQEWSRHWERGEEKRRQSTAEREEEYVTMRARVARAEGELTQARASLEAHAHLLVEARERCVAVETARDSAEADRLQLRAQLAEVTSTFL